MYKYSGVASIHGVPARDLTDDEYDKYRDRIRAVEKASGLTLYTKVKRKNNRSVSSTSEESEP